MTIDNLTLGEIKQIISMFRQHTEKSSPGLNNMLGQKVIIRTYSAGVWFGQLVEKYGNEVILKDARRMWYWKAAQSISLSAVATYGVDTGVSKIVEAIPSVWLEAIEIIPCSPVAIDSIEGAPNVEAS